MSFLDAIINSGRQPCEPSDLPYGRNPARGTQQLAEKVENLLDEAGVVPSDPDRLREYLTKLTAAAYQAGRTSVHREASRR